MTGLLVVVRAALLDFGQAMAQGLDECGAAAGQRQVRAEVWAFTDGASKERSVVIADLDADGRPEIVAAAAAGGWAWYSARSAGSGNQQPLSSMLVCFRSMPTCETRRSWSRAVSPE